MKRVILSLVVAVGSLAVLAGCGGGGSSSSSTSGVTITISPTSTSLVTSTSQQFTATVSTTTNTAVTWAVNSVVGGTSTIGFISTAGLYTAPNTVPAPATVTVTATSQADTTQVATASVTITEPSTPGTSLSVNPGSGNVPAGGQQTFTATVNGSPIAVTWNANCQSQATGGCGTFDQATGVYTAPLTPPPGGTVSITATANDNSVPPGGAVITVQFSNGTLKGQYAFDLSGKNAGASYLAAGSIGFDGNGNITGGTMDVNSGGVTSAPITGGSYHIGTDGRGNATVQTSAGNVTWQLAVVNHTQVQVARFDSGVAGASGSMELQDDSLFNAAGFAGKYAFSLSGATSSGVAGSLAAAGAVTSDGAGTINSGLLDVNSAGTASTALSLTGSYGTPDSTGRGTLSLASTFASQTFAYYIVDASHVKVIETDTGNQLLGELVKQPAGTFSAGSYTGGLVFAMLGSTSGAPLGEGGVLSFDGGGNVSSGTLDINANGNLQNGWTASGTYTVADAGTGRATVSLMAGGNTLQYVLYPQAGGYSMVEIDAPNTVAGRALAQSGSFSGGTLLGNYAVNLSGTTFIPSTGEEDLAGHAFLNGGSAINQNESSVAVNDSGTITASAQLGGSYSVGPSGRGAATLTTDSGAFARGSFNLYVANSNDALFLESDSNRVLVGRVQKQF